MIWEKENKMEQVERICISVNTECNLGCRYCYFFNPENRVSKESALSTDEIFTILGLDKDRILEFVKNLENVSKEKIERLKDYISQKICEHISQKSTEDLKREFAIYYEFICKVIERIREV
jgi:hypothetical protein